MSSICIDLRNGPSVDQGHDMFEQLVGAHMAAKSESDLLALVTLSMSEILDTNPEHAASVAIHAAYHGQAMVLRLLELLAQQRIALEDAGLTADPGIHHRQPDRFERGRVEIWNEVREHFNVSPG